MEEYNCTRQVLLVVLGQTTWLELLIIEKYKQTCHTVRHYRPQPTTFSLYKVQSQAGERPSPTDPNSSGENC